jgi:hypothetical protein
VYGQMMGIAFSLWRAVFLMDPQKATHWDQAEYFLETLIRENAVSFQTDRKARGWAANYYLNNARRRICFLVERTPRLKSLKPLCKVYEERNMDMFQLKPQEVWTSSYAALCALLEHMRAK